MYACNERRSRRGAWARKGGGEDGKPGLASRGLLGTSALP